VFYLNSSEIRRGPKSAVLLGPCFLHIPETVRFQHKNVQKNFLVFRMVMELSSFKGQSIILNDTDICYTLSPISVLWYFCLVLIF